MRTITEFFGMSLKAAAEKMPALRDEATKATQEAMKAEGKSDEEITAGLPTAAKAALDAKIGETYKLEGEKLAMFSAALDVFKDARGTVKRVIVQAKINEEEKAPGGAKEIDGKFYTVENFAEAQRAAPQEERGGKFGDKRGGKGGRGKGGPGGDRGGRPPRSGDRPAGRDSGEPRAPRPPRDAGAPGFTAVTGESGRPARTPRAPVEPYKGPNRIALKTGDAPKASEAKDSGSESSAT